MTLPPYLYHGKATTPIAGVIIEHHHHHRRLPKTTSLIESDATRDLKAMTSLNDMSRLPNASVVKLCHDDRFMNLVCDILNTTDTHSHAPCSLTHPTTTTSTTGATTITTAMSEQQEDNISDAMIPNLGGENTRFGLANEVVETPLVSSTTVRSPDNNMVGSSATHTKKKRKAEEDEPAAHYSPSLYLDHDSLKFDKHCPPLGEHHMVAKKTKTSTVGTSSSSSNS
jgi:hypothetical protein